MIKDTFETIFLNALKKLDDAYCRGALEYGKAKFPLTWNEMRRIEDEINRIWASGSTDEQTVRQFTEHVKRWYFLNLKILEYYRRIIQGRNWKRKYDSTEKYLKNGTSSFF